MSARALIHSAITDKTNKAIITLQQLHEHCSQQHGSITEHVHKCNHDYFCVPTLQAKREKLANKL